MSKKKIKWNDCYGKASEDSIRKTQETLGVTLPPLFIDMMRECDGGWPERAAFEYYDMSVEDNVQDCLGYFLGFEDGENTLVRFAQDPPPDFAEGIVAFGVASCGDHICFDYRKPEYDGNPPIVFWFHEAAGTDTAVSFIAKDFETFIEMLDTSPFVFPDEAGC